MQQSVPPILNNWFGRHRAVTVALAWLAGAVAGCGEVAIAPPPATKPNAGAKLTLACPDPALADALAPMLASWEARTGARVTVLRQGMAPADDADLGVVAAGELGVWAEDGKLTSLPGKLRDNRHPVQWFGFLAAADRQVSWGAKTFAVPLTGDGVVLGYRADRLGDPAARAAFTAQSPTKRELTPPATWDELAEVALFFAARDKRPSLPPLPVGDEARLDLLCRVAASFDRPAYGDKDLEGRNQDAELLAFQFGVQTGRPRLDAPGFQAAAGWVAGLH
ncbi:MAG: hypothetical protein K2V38_02850, partial [Gemmataceae bacterium]|nr:hypothetical protein [Gemmataceae bacterium]